MAQQLEELHYSLDAEQQFGYEFLEKDITDSMVDFYRWLKSSAISESVISRTPVHIVNTWVNGNKALAKCESEQPNGSFKIRGALNAIRLADPDLAAAGIVAASAGNHAQGVALASKEFGYNATVFMPVDTPKTKQEATRLLGATVELIDGDFDTTNEFAEQFAEQRGLLLIPPFDNQDVIAGQGTVVLEALEQAPETDIMYVPVGGGGFLAGAILAAKYHQQQYGGKLPQIIGVESSALPSMQQALINDGPYKLPEAQTLAEGIAVRKVGDLPYIIVSQAYAEGIVDFVSVTDEELMDAMLTQEDALSTNMGEGAGAAALAGAFQHTRSKGLGQKNLLIMDSGRNIDPAKVNEIHRVDSEKRNQTAFRNLGSRAALQVWKGR